MSVGVFGYGSLVDPRSIGLTLGVDLPPPVPAELPGHRPAWVVGTATAGLTDRHWTTPAGVPFDGVVVSLGLVPGGSCPGAVHRVPSSRLHLLHARERDYTPVTLPATTAAGAVDVLTYRQTAAAERVLREAGEAVVTEEYLGMVEAAFAALGATSLDLYRRAVPPPPCPVVPLVFHEGPRPVGG